MWFISRFGQCPRPFFYLLIFLNLITLSTALSHNKLSNPNLNAVFSECNINQNTCGLWKIYTPGSPHVKCFPKSGFPCQWSHWREVQDSFCLVRFILLILVPYLCVRILLKCIKLKKNWSLQRKSFLLGDVLWNSYFRRAWLSRAIQLSRESVLTLLCSIVSSFSRILCGLWAQMRIPRAPRTRLGTQPLLNHFCSTFASLSHEGNRPTILSSTEARALPGTTAPALTGIYFSTKSQSLQPYFQTQLFYYYYFF